MIDTESTKRLFRTWCKVENKWGYLNRREALEALVRRRAERNVGVHKERGVYRGEHCSCWHLTKSIQHDPHNNAPEVREKMLKYKRTSSRRRSKKA